MNQDVAFGSDFGGGYYSARDVDSLRMNVKGHCDD